MAWLTTQIWSELLIAAVIGGLVGWAVHVIYLKRSWIEPAPADAPRISGPEGRERIAELESKLEKTEAEVDDLRRRSGILPLGHRGQPPEGSIAWRNRILESRVRFLEGKLADIESEGPREHAGEAHDDEATRLRWRNRYLEGRVRYLEEELIRTGGLTPAAVIPAALAQREAVRPKPVEEDRPELFEQPCEGRADDLKMISGIGPKLEQKLNSLGIWHYTQIASWTPREVAWVNSAISFRGRVERERWVSQAIALLERNRKVDVERAPETNGA